MRRFSFCVFALFISCSPSSCMQGIGDNNGKIEQNSTMQTKDKSSLIVSNYRKENGDIVTMYSVCQYDRSDIVAAMLDLEVDPELVLDLHQHKCLHMAALSNSVNLTNVLLMHGANINTRNDKLFTPLMLAAFYDSVDVIEFLLNKSADTTLKNIDDLTALDIATHSNKTRAGQIIHDHQIKATPTCSRTADCDLNKSCINNKCRDPCPGLCGELARCDVINHIPGCSCPDGYEGDPFTYCRVEVQRETLETKNPCSPSPCGSNSLCRLINRKSQAECSCLPDHDGAPPNCRAKCNQSSECPNDKACVKKQCLDTCPGACGLKATCDVINHVPVCSCPQGFLGDPFTACVQPVEKARSARYSPQNPCSPSPCGANSQCHVVNNDHPLCSCLPDHDGSPPNCRSKCNQSSECPNDQECVNKQCIEACPGSCGFNAVCDVINHVPACTCRAGQYGDPFQSCFILAQNSSASIQDIKVTTTRLSRDEASSIVAKYRKEHDDTDTLSFACISNRSDIVEALLDLGVDPEVVVNVHNQTCLLVASYNNYLDLARLLLKHGANVNVKDVEQTTPLMRAATIGLVDMTKLLLDFKADVNITNFKNQTALAIAKAMNHVGVVEILKSKGAHE